jgi:hypothetical protein
MRSLQEFNWLKMNQKNWVQDGDFKPSCPNDRIWRSLKICSLGFPAYTKRPAQI